nr:hypothetical protein [Enhygromyxa salina]
MSVVTLIVAAHTSGAPRAIHRQARAPPAVRRFSVSAQVSAMPQASATCSEGRQFVGLSASRTRASSRALALSSSVSGYSSRGKLVGTRTNTSAQVAEAIRIVVMSRAPSARVGIVSHAIRLTQVIVPYSQTVQGTNGTARSRLVSGSTWGSNTTALSLPTA